MKLRVAVERGGRDAHQCLCGPHLNRGGDGCAQVGDWCAWMSGTLHTLDAFPGGPMVYLEVRHSSVPRLLHPLPPLPAQHCGVQTGPRHVIRRTRRVPVRARRTRRAGACAVGQCFRFFREEDCYRPVAGALPVLQETALAALRPRPDCAEGGIGTFFCVRRADHMQQSLLVREGLGGVCEDFERVLRGGRSGCVG